MRLRRLTLAVATFVATLALAASGSAAAPRSLVVAHLRLDTYHTGTAIHTPAVGGPRLAKGKLYVATVQGTISFYAAIDYFAPQAPFTAFCGTPLRAPLFASAGGVGKVGNDSQFILAQPIATGTCASDPLPRAWLNFQADNGFGWVHPPVLSARSVTKPTATHAYDYAFVGQGKPLRFELDDPDTNDDYGAFHITVRRAIASDCAGTKWKAFALKRRNICIGDTRHTHGTVPAQPAVHPLTLSQASVVHVARDSDIVGGHNLELPAGALAAGPFAAVTSTGAGAPSWARTLERDGLRTAAVSAFDGPTVPTIESTAVLTRSAADARGLLAASVTRATGIQKPAGDSVTVTAEAAIPGARLVSYTSAAGPAGEMLLAASGSGVYTLRELGTPTGPVSAAPAVEQLLATFIAR